MKVLIVGYGSAGKRHAENAKALGHDVAIYDPPRGIGTWDESLDANAAIIASPPHVHLRGLSLCTQANMPVLVEKPFCLPEQIIAAKGQIAANDAPVMVGHNLFWSDDWRRFRESIPEAPQVYRATFAYDLRKQLKGRADSYQRHADQGGGVLLDCVQDIALALDVVGPVSDIGGLRGRMGHVTEDADDWAHFSGRGASGTFISWHFDYLNPERIRRHEAWGDGWYRVWDERPDPDSYRKMLADFLTWVDTGREPAIRPDPFSALEVIRQCL
jgi:predicted dehydrogenase